ncbi:MAG TPA: hypothetical protein VFU89_00465 [Rhabdochlamydiaceae bacterium]|nr:hypothetical protein [Rhabdochlamydiaceae bacterium]
MGYKFPSYSIVRKATVLKTVGEDCQGLKIASSPLKIDKENKRFNIHQVIHFFNDIPFKKHSLHVVELEETAQKKPSKRFAKVQFKKTHWEWLVHQNLNNANAAAVASNSRIRWKEENLFNDLQHREFAICHDFNRAPTAQSIRSFLILIAYAISSILTHSSLGRSILSEGHTITFIMKQMLTDLIYISETTLFHCRDPTQLRF